MEGHGMNSMYNYFQRETRDSKWMKRALLQISSLNILSTHYIKFKKPNTTHLMQASNITGAKISRGWCKIFKKYCNKKLENTKTKAANLFLNPWVQSPMFYPIKISYTCIYVCLEKRCGLPHISFSFSCSLKLSVCES